MAASHPSSLAAASPGPWLRATRLPPGGEAVALSALHRASARAEPGVALAAALSRHFDGLPVSLFVSGREALRALLVHLARERARSEVVVPAYTCWSVAAAAVAAGCRVRLVDVDERGRLDLDHLARLPLDRAAAVIVSNLYGVPEPVGPVADLAGPAGAAVIDDAAQAFGCPSAEGPVGGRGDWGILSFDRGKPLSALGGGALVGPALPGAPAPAAEGDGRARLWLRALLWDGALAPPLFRLLAAIPALGIGETPFDPGFPSGPMPGAQAALALETLPDLGSRRLFRVAEALALAARLPRGFRPLLADPADTGAYPRLGVRAPSAAVRQRALAALTVCGAGASGSYPASLDAVPGLAASRVGDDPVPGARDLAACVLTLPTHGRLRGTRLEHALTVLAEAAPA